TTGLIGADELGSIGLGEAVNGCVDCEFRHDGTVRARLLVPPGFRPVDYTGVAVGIPRGSRFLPPLSLHDALTVAGRSSTNATPPRAGRALPRSRRSLP